MISFFWRLRFLVSILKSRRRWSMNYQKEFITINSFKFSSSDFIDGFWSIRITVRFTEFVQELFPCSLHARIWWYAKHVSIFCFVKKLNSCKNQQLEKRYLPYLVTAVCVCFFSSFESLKSQLLTVHVFVECWKWKPTYEGDYGLGFLSSGTLI